MAPGRSRPGPPTRQRRARGRRPGSADGAARRRRTGGLTARAAVLGLVFCAIVLSLAYPVRTYLAQRSEISQLQQQKHAGQQRVADLTARQAKVQDPSVTIAQARQRLHFVLPGETEYIVLAPKPEPATTTPAPAARAHRSAGNHDARPWYSQLWQTVTAADDASR